MIQNVINEKHKQMDKMVFVNSNSEKIWTLLFYLDHHEDKTYVYWYDEYGFNDTWYYRRDTEEFIQDGSWFIVEKGESL